MTEAQFAELLSDKNALETYFLQSHKLESRLHSMIELFLKDALKLQELKTMDVEKLISEMCVKGILLYGKTYFQDIKKSNVMKEKELKKFITEQYQSRLEEKIEVFDFDFCERWAEVWTGEWEEKFCCIYKKCSGLFRSEDYMILSRKRERSYIKREVSEKELENVIDQSQAVLISFKEFHKQRNKPKFFERKKRPLFVVLTEYTECKEWIEQIQDEDLYFVDTYEKEFANFYTLLFFRRRIQPDIIFVYPTMKILAEKLISQFALTEKLMYFSEEESIKMFSIFEKSEPLLQAIIWLFSFLCGTEWNGKVSDAASMLSCKFVTSLADAALQIRPSGYWKYRAALPTENTESAGVYALMEFINGKNTGLLCATEQEGKDQPLFFLDKENAIQYKRKVSGYQNYKVVGVDRYYWDILKKYLEHGERKCALFLEHEKGVLLDPEAFWYVVR